MVGVVDSIIGKIVRHKLGQGSSRFNFTKGDSALSVWTGGAHIAIHGFHGNAVVVGHIDTLGSEDDDDIVFRATFQVGFNDVGDLHFGKGDGALIALAWVYNKTYARLFGGTKAQSYPITAISNWLAIDIVYNKDSSTRFTTLGFYVKDRWIPEN